MFMILDPFMDREMRNLFPMEKDLPGIRQGISGEEIDERCLACPIWANGGGEDAFLKAEVNIICGADHAKILSKFFRSEKIRHVTIVLSKFVSIKARPVR
jgi:hypothetical protein